MGYIVAARLHDQSLDLPYLAIGGTDGQFAAYVYPPNGTESTVTSCGASGRPGPRSGRTSSAPGIPKTPGDKGRKLTLEGEWDSSARWGPGPAQPRSPGRVGAPGTRLGCSEAGSDPS